MDSIAGGEMEGRGDHRSHRPGWHNPKCHTVLVSGLLVPGCNSRGETWFFSDPWLVFNGCLRWVLRFKRSGGQEVKFKNSHTLPI